MNSTERPDRYVVGRDNMAGERDAVGENISAADDAIVRDMHLRHEQIVVADLRQSAAACGPSMDRHCLAYLIAFADLGLGGLAFVF